MRVSPAIVLPLAMIVTGSVGACLGDDPLPVASSGQDSGPPTPGTDSGSASEAGPTSEGGVSCTAPLADCNNDGACETSLESDPRNCGTCGHDCGTGATCAGKTCQPVTLAKSLAGPVSLAVNATALVILKQGGPGVCPKDGCSGNPTSLGGGDYFPAEPHTVYADAENAYWLGRQTAGAQYALYKCAIAGCALAPVVIDDEQFGMEMRGEGNAILRYDPTGYATKIYTDNSSAKEYFTIATRPSSLRFVVTSGKMAFSNTDSATESNAGVWAGDFTNVNPTRIMNVGRMVAIANGSVFASRPEDATYDAIYACPFGGCGGVGARFGGTGASAGTGKIADMAADASGVYWVESIGQTGRVMRCGLPDCASGPQALAVAQDKPVAITLDDKFVYWVNAGSTVGNGAVLRVAK